MIASTCSGWSSGPGSSTTSPSGGLNQIGVGTEIGHWSGIVRNDPADPGQHRQIGAAFRLRFGQEGHLPSISFDRCMPQIARPGNASAIRGRFAVNAPTGGDTHEQRPAVRAFDFSTAHEDEFHDWYDNEHIPERLRVPGFLNAERWIGEENPKFHVATYDLDTRRCPGQRRPTARSAATTSRSGPSASPG